jgi:acid phosphatase
VSVGILLGFEQFTSGLRRKLEARRYFVNVRRLMILFVAGLGLNAHAQIACTGEKSKVPVFKNVVIVVEENQSFEDVIRKDSKMPYLNDLAARGGLAHRYYANTHPSINNYFILTAGRRGTTLPYGLADTFGGIVSGDNVASILTRHDKSWKAYAENLPRMGYVGDGGDPQGLYVKRHNPFAYLKSVVDPASGLSQRENIVPFKQFAADLKDNKLPNYSFVVPNLVNDAHDNPKTRRLARCGDEESLQVADDWLKKNIKPLLDSESFQEDGLLIIVFDEACDTGSKKDGSLGPKQSGGGGGHIAGVLVGAHLPETGCVSDTIFHHESILRLSLRALGVEEFPGAAATAPDLGEFFVAEH